jgi:hypothetical protein
MSLTEDVVEEVLNDRGYWAEKRGGASRVVAVEKKGGVVASSGSSATGAELGTALITCC